MPTAKYIQVAQEIKKRIKSGQYHPDELLPDQETLAKEFGVSRLTVKKAIDGLERKGLVYKQSGLGTYVSAPIPIKSKTDTPANFFMGLDTEMGKGRVTSQVLHFTVEFPSPEIQKNLSLKKNEPVYDIIRLRLLDGEPFVIEHTFMPLKTVPDLDEEILSKSVYHYIHHDLNLKFGRAYRRILASKPDDLDKKFLHAAPDDPMLELEQLVWLTNGTPVEYSYSRSRYDSRSYTVFENNRF
ncbi:GntR family transcriptional regulator [Lactobacillus pasteurii]|uniref:Transcriptional regulator n=1 Tax=Lactobacillus pasteurii DSM 23907 = CRBIP 24.76 TaxID=1423790 RepID=I7IZ22_9LACO|nr:GntR family transcriptional regulator [Lactobacillus pasteurii]TDG77301.1 hypothetical protein C5L33_000744 [Lactobacillus pasteurii]CCI84847.1 Transcriptional regulator [Lactobacillus pasteurii DSM 23907 = CRBIP 24.76]